MMENDLPEGWESTTLEKIAFWGSGGTPSRGDSSYYGGDIPWIKTGDLNNSIILEVNEYLTEKGLKNSSAKIFPKGSIGIAMYGATIGKTALFGIDAATNQACAVAQVYEGISNIFLHYYLKSQKENFIEKGKGGAQPNISQGVIKLHPIPLPPLAEQKRIVAKLDAAFGLLDRMKERLARIPELLKNFRQAVLTQAVTGKLTEDWREENGVQESKKILDSIAWKDSAYKKKKASLFQNIEEAPFDIPEEWKFVNLGILCYKMAYGTSEKSMEIGKIPVLRMGNLQNGKIDWTDLKYTSNLEEIEKYALRKGDVLFNRTNSPELVGKTSIFESEEAAIYAGYLIKIWNYEELNSYYLNHILNSPYGRSWSWNVKSDGVSQSNINAQKLSDLLIPFPSPQEQQEIVRRVEALLAKADAIEAQYLALKEKIDRLPQALLAQAFRGELVPQDPTDESAAVLLGKLKSGKQGVLF